MSPRSYTLGKREAGVDQTRSRILESARQLLAGENETDLGMEAIARRADVSRLTLYYQFGSRAGLLEALYDYLAARGNMRRMAEVFHEPDPSKALDNLVRTFIGFWSSDPVVIRRLRSMAALDPEIGKGVHDRDSRRLHAAREIMRRAQALNLGAAPSDQGHAVHVLGMLTGFETYDALARSGQSEEQIFETIRKLSRAISGV
jgi:AcrR family transcriptional regulator